MTHISTTPVKQGTVSWESPSNIAIVKYWGKKEGQLPMNPSLSMTLNKSVTRITINYRLKQNDGPHYSFKFHDKPITSFTPKLDTFFSHLLKKHPFLLNYHFDIQSVNSFPHSAGIASSASAMSALALCTEEIAHLAQSSRTPFHPSEAAEMARLGSGSAVRSLHPHWALWGQTTVLPNSSDRFAIAIEEVAPGFRHYCDTILLVDTAQKEVSSSAGHQLMQNHPYQQGRMAQANENIKLLLTALRNGDHNQFVTVCEEEALSLHALMMSSRPGYLLMKPGTLQIIEQTRMFREKSGIPVCFTLDAGPNVHLLYPEIYAAEVMQWVNRSLSEFCENGKFIEDGIGKGPRPVND